MISYKALKRHACALLFVIFLCDQENDTLVPVALTKKYIRAFLHKQEKYTRVLWEKKKFTKNENF